MQINQIYDVDILKYANNGEGICYLNDKIAFVKYAPINCNVKIKIDKINNKYINATMIEINKKNKEIATPICPYFTKCGGCDLQYMTYPEQLEFKREKVKDAIKKFANQNVKVTDTVPSDFTEEYRNKIQLQIGYVSGRVAVGFYDKDSHNIVSISKCKMYGVWAEKIIKIFTLWANKYRITAYNEKTSRGVLRNLTARNIGNKLVITLVINADKIDNIDELQNSLAKEFDNFALYLSVNKKKNSAILGDKLLKIYDNEMPITIDGIQCNISPYSFFQVNDNVRIKLYKEVVKNVDNNNSIIIDAYSGIGILSAQLAKKCNVVFGIDIVPEAIKNADNLCEKNGLCPQITNICGDTAIILPKLVNLFEIKDRRKFAEFIEQNTFQKVDLDKYNSIFSNEKNNLTVVLDPPRKGCDYSVLQSVIDSKANKIIYVSCDPITLSRDINILSRSYSIIKIQPFDMFPYSHHVETLCCLMLKEATKG